MLNSTRIASTEALWLLGTRGRGAGQHGPGRLLGVDRVGLAGEPPLLPVRPVDLDHLDLAVVEEPSQPGPVAAGAFDPDPPEQAEPVQPVPQRLVAVGVSGEHRCSPRRIPDTPSTATTVWVSVWVSTPPITTSGGAEAAVAGAVLMRADG